MSGQPYLTFDDSFQRNTVPETEETVLDAMIRAGSSTGLGWEDVYVLLTDAGFKLDRDRVRRIVIPKITTPAQRAIPSGR